MSRMNNGGSHDDIAIEMDNITSHDARPNYFLSNGAAVNSNTNESVTTGSDSEPCIFKVHKHLRNGNNKDYEPAIISIGPYHRSEKSFHLKLMEEHKLRFQESMLKRRNENLDTYVAAIERFETRARKSYSESTAHMDLGEFVEMLVLDGIFIIELLSKFDKFKSDNETHNYEDPRGRSIRNDPIFKMPWALSLLQRDLMLFENQLPFFILVELHRMIAPPGNTIEDLNGIAVRFFTNLYPASRRTRTDSIDRFLNIKHLVDLVHMDWGRSRQPLVSSTSVEYSMENTGLIKNSTWLRQAGVKFEKITGGDWFGIEFEDGVLRIPVLTIEERTESFLRNLIAFEQYRGLNTAGFHTVTDYMTFLSCLIESDKDIVNLTEHGILRSFAVNDADANRMFSTIVGSTVGITKNFHYGQIFQTLNRLSDDRKDAFMTVVRRSYYNSTWGIISIVGATAVVLFTFFQLGFQIASFARGK